MIVALAAVGLLSLAALHISITILGARAEAISRRTEQTVLAAGLRGKASTFFPGRYQLLAQSDPARPPAPEPRGRALSVDPQGRLIAFTPGVAGASLSPDAVRVAAAPVLEKLKTARPDADGMVTATSVGVFDDQPELSIALRKAPGAPTMVGVINLNDYITDYARNRQLQDFALVGIDSPKLKQLSVPIDFDGAPARFALQWTPRSPVREIIGPLAPILWLFTIIALAGGAWVAHRARQLSRRLSASEAHAQHLALHDTMTGLANRALFSDRLDHALELRRRTGGGLAVVCIDLDRFKQVNDTLGHQAGDEMIKTAARRILGVSRASDTVARLGGDEFALVLAPVGGRKAVELVCSRLNAALSGKLEFPSGQAYLSASIGVTLIEDDKLSGADAMRQADLALYAAKHGGRGRFILFEPKMDESLHLRHQIEVDLRGALDASALQVAYQPQINLRGKIDGLEALVRWQHAERGAISPAYFIPIAEEAGLIHRLGRFVMTEAFAMARRWPGLRMAVNVSPVQLREPGFVALCKTLLAEAGVEARQIELEITEGVLVDNDNTSHTVLTELRDAGFKLALDDFGTGYSSLSYLNAYPIDKIKIDRSFVANLGMEAEADKVVRAIIKLGRALGLKVTAEGVETEAQQQRLISAGCSSFQGYLHGRPCSPDDIEAMLRAAQKPAAA